MTINSPLFSVIIPTCNRNSELSQCLDCLAPGVQTFASTLYEVIVTDDGFGLTAENMIISKYTWVKWVSGPRQGPAANRNNGSNYAKGKWIVFTDDDCLPDKNWLATFAAAINQEDLALEGRIYPLGKVDEELAECPVNQKGGLFWTANVAIRRDVFEKVGKFDPFFLRYHEDIDLQLRLQQQNVEIKFVPEAFVIHPVRILTLSQSLRKIPQRCADWARYMSKRAIVLTDFNPLIFVFTQYKFVIASLWSNLKKMYFKAMCVDFAMLMIGIPLRLACFYKNYIHYTTNFP